MAPLQSLGKLWSKAFCEVFTGTRGTGEWKQSHLIPSLPQRSVDEEWAVDTISLDFSKAFNSLSGHIAVCTSGYSSVLVGENLISQATDYSIKADTASPTLLST